MSFRRFFLPYQSSESTFRYIVNSVHQRIHLVMGTGWCLVTLFFVGLFLVGTVHEENTDMIVIFFLLEVALTVILSIMPPMMKKLENSTSIDFLIFMGWNFPVILGLYWLWAQLNHVFSVGILLPSTPLLLTVIGFELFLILVAVLLAVLLNFLRGLVLDQTTSSVRSQANMPSFTPSFMMAIFLVLWLMLNLYSIPFIISSILLPNLVESLFFVLVFWTFQLVTSLLLSLSMLSFRKSVARNMIATSFGSLIESLSQVDWNDPGSWHSFVRSIFNDLDIQIVNELFNELQHVLPALFYQIRQHRSWGELTTFLESQAYILKNTSSTGIRDDSLQDFKVDYLLWKISYFFYALQYDPRLVRALLMWGDNVPQVNMFQAFLIRMSLKSSRDRLSASILNQIVEHVCQLGFPEFLLETEVDRFYHLLDVETRSYLALNLLFNTSFELVSDKSVFDFSFIEMVRTRQVPQRLFWDNIMTLSMLGADPLFSLLYPLMTSYPDNWTKNEMLWKMYGLSLEEPALTLLLVGRHVDLRVLNDMELFFEWLLQSFVRVPEDLVHFTLLAWQLQQINSS